jgi:hypothetical protein
MCYKHFSKYFTLGSERVSYYKNYKYLNTLIQNKVNINYILYQAFPSMKFKQNEKNTCTHHTKHFGKFGRVGMMRCRIL